VSVEKRVARGCEFLDQAAASGYPIAPNWRELIDCDELNVGHNEKCILGQLFPNEGESGYTWGMKRLDLTDGDTIQLGLDGIDHDDYNELNMEWWRVLCGSTK
jgi:hypothetical protein